MNRYAIVLTHNRPDMLKDCVAAIAGQVDTVIVVDNASDPPVQVQDLPFDGATGFLLAVAEQPPNLSRLWNLALDMITGWQGDQPGPWPIAVLCDDSVVPDGWFAAVTDAMAATGAAAGCSNPWGQHHEPRVKTAPDADIMGRMPGWAFVIDASKGLRADESMRWWFLDTDLDWQARAAGGMVMIGGYPVPNQLPNDYTNRIPGLGEQAGRDGETFAAKHGWRPW